MYLIETQFRCLGVTSGGKNDGLEIVAELLAVIVRRVDANHTIGIRLKQNDSFVKPSGIVLSYMKMFRGTNPKSEMEKAAINTVRF